MIIDSPIISGSQNASGPLTQIGNVEITGSLSVTGTINGSITGSVTSASYATSAEFLDGLDSTSFVFTSSFNDFSGSAAGRITNLEAFSSSLDTVFATDASVTASILVLSGSVQASQAALSSSYTITSGSYASASGSLSIRTTNLEATSSTLVSASSSFAADSASLSTRLTGDEANITTLTNASGSFAAQSASLSTRITQDETNFTNLSSSFATTSGSISSRVTIIEGQDATTGSNVFTGPQFINQASNAISFTSTASLYTDGGLRVSKDSFVSGTAYFNNVVVYGTSSIQYITSSQVNFGTNIITVNTDTPAVRFGGLAVFDSGSTQLTGSMLWDSEKNHWIYSNPSGSTYNSAMLMNGPRNTGSLGSEQGTTACALMMGQGGDHITSSMIYSYGNATCFYGNSYIDSSGNSCQAGYAVVNNCLGIGTASPSVYGVDASNASNSVYFKATSNATTAYYGAATALGTGVAGTFSNHDFALYANSVERARITSTGIACFACQVCAAGNLLLGGAGTANTIPQYTAAGVLGNSKMVTYGNGCYNVNFGWSNCARIGFDNDNTGTYFYGLELDNGTRRLNIIGKAPDGNTGVGIWTGTTSYSQRLNIGSDGLACFACQVCAPTISISGNVNGGTATFNGVAINNSPTSAGTSANFIRLTNTGGDFYIGQESSTGGFFTGAGAYDNVLYGGRPLNIIMGGSSKVVIATNGVATFACQICTVAVVTADLRYTGTGYITYDTSASGTSCLIFRQNGTEKMRISECGYVAVTGNQGLACVPYLQGMSFGWNRSNGQGESMINWTNQGGGVACDLTFNFRDSTTLYERLRLSSTGIACFAGTVCALNFITPGITNSTSAICSNYVKAYCDTSDTRYLQLYMGNPSTYNPASANTVCKIVSGISFNWYSECWLMGATRGGGADIDSFVIGRNGATNMTINSAGKVMIATSCAAFGRNLTVQGDVVAYYSDQESVTMGISAGTGAQSWGIQVCDTGDGSNTLHLNARGGYVGINKGAGNSASYPLDVSGTTKTDILLVGSACSPSAGINYLGQEGYRQKWLITQGRYRFCFGTEDFYGAIFIEMYGTNYNQGTSEVRVGKAVIPLRYATSRSIIQVYDAGGVCVGAYRTNGIGLVWCNINGTVGDLIYTNAGSLQPDSVLATELQLLSNGFSLAGRFYRMCYVNTLYDSVNPYV